MASRGAFLRFLVLLPTSRERFISMEGSEEGFKVGHRQLATGIQPDISMDGTQHEARYREVSLKTIILTSD